MRLSEFQTKEVINISTGKRLGYIIDAIITKEGFIKELVLEERKSKRFISQETTSISWNQIVKIGDDIVLIDTRNRQI